MNILDPILTSLWAIDRMSANAYIPFVASLINGKNPAQLLPKKQEFEINMRAISSDNVGSFVYGTGDIAVMRIKGVLMKDDALYSYGTEYMNARLHDLIDDSTVKGILLYIDSPGGEASFTSNFSDTIKNSPKPIITYTNRIMASAAYWLGSSALEVYASSKNDQIGSIGTMVSFADFSGALEKAGIKEVEIYADGSEDKNDRYYLMKKGDEESLQKLRDEWLNPLNESFHEAVKNNRNNIDQSAMTGKMYYANDAIELGLIDGIKTYEECIARLEELIILQAQSNNVKSSTMNKNQQKVAALLGYDSLESKDGFISLSTADVEKIGENLPSPESTEQDGDEGNNAVLTAVAQLTESVQGISTQLGTIESRVASLENTKPASAGASTVVPANTETDASAEESVDPWNDPANPLNKMVEQDLI